MPAVLFVCTGNICRSPMATALFKQKIESQPDAEEWQVESAGTWAAEDMPASPNAQIVLASRFVLDLTGHRSRRVSGEILREFDLILTMERGHQEALRIEFPEAADRIHLLSEMIDKDYDIHDPIGGSVRDYEDTALKLQELLSSGAEKIRRLAEQNASRRAKA